MKSLGIFGILFVVAFFNNAFAQNTLSELIKENPNATRWEVLKEFYETSSLPAELSDFDFVGDESNQKCRLAFPKSTPNTLQKVVLKKFKKAINEDNGPLFPERTVVKLSITNESHSNPASYKKLFEFITIESDSYDLIVHQRKNTNHDDSPFTIKLRKNNNLISFKLLTFKDNQDNGPLFEEDADDSYGYCWK